ncbi:MAG: hypothetical protein JW782_06175 [Candidatus Saganbacteria bacterium]|nr:hypothetical protein [Candidatus Saganbacteria bacterium]
MTRKTFLTALLFWFILAVLANINGLVRNFGYGPYVGEQAAHQLSTVIFCILILLATYVMVKLARPARAELIWIGIFWLVATIAFEFLFGHYVVGHSWEHLLADYNILKGRVWGIVLLVTLLAPLITGEFVK